jgi:hypothetical protein
MTITNHEPWSPRSDDSYVDPYDFTDHEAEDADEEEEDVVDPPWSPRRDESYEDDDDDEYVSDDNVNEEVSSDAAAYFGPYE